MAAFKFRLEKVLGQRLRVEDERKSDLARVQSLINRERARIDDLASWRRHAKATAAGVLDAQHIFLMTSSCDRAAAARRRIKSIEPELERARAAYVRARQERLAIEKLRERELAEFRKRERLAEERMLSELAEQEHIRKMNEIAEEEADA
jgi:flagellar FliJ protein